MCVCVCARREGGSERGREDMWECVWMAYSQLRNAAQAGCIKQRQREGQISHLVRLATRGVSPSTTPQSSAARRDEPPWATAVMPPVEHMCGSGGSGGGQRMLSMLLFRVGAVCTVVRLRCGGAYASSHLPCSNASRGTCSSECAGDNTNNSNKHTGARARAALAHAHTHYITHRV